MRTNYGFNDGSDNSCYHFIPMSNIDNDHIRRYLKELFIPLKDAYFHFSYNNYRAVYYKAIFT